MKPNGAPPSTPAQNLSEFDEARDLFGKMSAEAFREAEAERRAAPHRSPFVKLLLALTVAACLAAAATFFYGIYAFPDAPLRKSAAGFQNKQGLTRSEADFNKFKLWEKTLFASFGSAFVLAFAFGIINSREKRRRLK